MGNCHPKSYQIPRDNSYTDSGAPTVLHITRGESFINNKTEYEGRYTLRNDKQANGYPVWERETMQLYTNTSGHWVLGDETDRINDTHKFSTRVPHNGGMPHYGKVTWEGSGVYRDARLLCWASQPQITAIDKCANHICMRIFKQDISIRLDKLRRRILKNDILPYLTLDRSQSVTDICNLIASASIETRGCSQFASEIFVHKSQVRFYLMLRGLFRLISNSKPVNAKQLYDAIITLPPLRRLFGISEKKLETGFRTSDCISLSDAMSSGSDLKGSDFVRWGMKCRYPFRQHLEKGIGIQPLDVVKTYLRCESLSGLKIIKMFNSDPTLRVILRWSSQQVETVTQAIDAAVHTGLSISSIEFGEIHHLLVLFSRLTTSGQIDSKTFSLAVNNCYKEGIFCSRELHHSQPTIPLKRKISNPNNSINKYVKVPPSPPLKSVTVDNEDDCSISLYPSPKRVNSCSQTTSNEDGSCYIGLPIQCGCDEICLCNSRDYLKDFQTLPYYCPMCELSNNHQHVFTSLTNTDRCANGCSCLCSVGLFTSNSSAVFDNLDKGGLGYINFSDFFIFFMNAKKDINFLRSKKTTEKKTTAPTSICELSELLKQFKIIRRLGEGCYGVVDLVRRRSDNRLYVLKKPKSTSTDLNKQLKVNHPSISMLDSEALILSSVSHKHIVQYVCAAITDQGGTAIVTEYVNGGDLRQKLLTSGALKAPTDLNWFIQICSAIQYLHSRDLIHRDVKPDNILISSNGVLKLGDLGLAKKLSHKNSRGELVTHSVLRGPEKLPTYMSPEQVRCESHGKQVDIWALGCLLFEMSTAKCAFKSPSAVSSGLIPRDIPASCCDLVLFMLEIDKVQRPNINQVIEKVNQSRNNRTARRL